MHSKIAIEKNDSFGWSEASNEVRIEASAMLLYIYRSIVLSLSERSGNAAAAIMPSGASAFQRRELSEYRCVFFSAIFSIETIFPFFAKKNLL